MDEDWIEQRHQRYVKDLENKQHVSRSRTNAQVSYAAFFDTFREAVQHDIENYNRLFAAHEGCRALFGKSADGFSVTRVSGTVMVVKKSSGTIITIEYFTKPNRPATKHASIEVATDERGNIGYKQNGQFWEDASDASRSVLEEADILCG